MSFACIAITRKRPIMASTRTAVLCLLLAQRQRENESRRVVQSAFRRLRNRRRLQTRYRVVLLLLLLTSTLTTYSTVLRTVWIRRNSQWWERIVLQTFEPTDWLENFRMRKETFLYLYEKLTPSICRQNT